MGEGVVGRLGEGEVVVGSWVRVKGLAGWWGGGEWHAWRTHPIWSASASNDD